MKSSTIRVAAVSYTNTIPFIYGLRAYPGIAGLIDLRLMPPAACAGAYSSGDVDIALVPVGAMEEYHLNELCCNWCLGAEGPVESVLLMTNTNLQQLHTIYLDPESRTSVLMVQMIARYQLKIHPEYICTGNRHLQLLKPGEAMLLIGDKVFRLRYQFRYRLDLAEAWLNMTGLPAVFACWLTRSGITMENKRLINEALGWGVRHIPEAIRAHDRLILSFDETLRYLTHCISFHLDDPKREAILRYLGYRKQLEL